MSVFPVFTKEILRGLFPYIFKDLCYSSNKKNRVDYVYIKKNQNLIYHIQIKEEYPEVEFIKWINVLENINKNVYVKVEKKYNLKKIYDKYDNNHDNTKVFYNKLRTEYNSYRKF